MKLFSAKTNIIFFLLCLFVCSYSLAGWKFGKFDGRKNYKLTIPDSEGVPVTFRLTGGGWGEVDGPDFEQIILYDTTENSIFRITTRGKGTETSIGNITVEGSLFAIIARTTDLRENISIGGMLAAIQLDDAIEGGIITIGEPVGTYASDANFGVLMKFDEVDSLVIDSFSPIRTLIATEWLNSSSEIYAPSIGTLQITGSKKRDIPGDFEASLFLGEISSSSNSYYAETKIIQDTNSIPDGNSVPDANAIEDTNSIPDTNSLQPSAGLLYARIPGSVGSCEWNIAGNVKTIRVNSGANDWMLNIQGDSQTITVNSDANNCALNINGNARNIRINGDANDLILNIYGDVNALRLNDINNSDVNVAGSIYLLRAAGWFDSNMEVGADVINGVIKQLHGTVNIGGNAKNFTICEPMAVSAPNSVEPIGTFSVTGKSNVRSLTGRIRFTNSTIYTNEPNMYRLEDLRRYNIPDEGWEYTSSYRIRSSGGNNSGIVYSTIDVLDVNEINDGSSFDVEKICVDDVNFVTSWYNDSNGTKLRRFASNTTLGQLDLTLNVNMPGHEFLKPRETYKDAGPFYGSWGITVYDKNDEAKEIDVSDITGTVKTMISLVCHEQITLPTGVYLAAKVKSSIKMNGIATVTIGDEEYPGKFSLSQGQVFWAIPEIGIIKAVTNTSYGIRANRKTYYFKIAQIDQLTSSSSLIDMPPEVENN